MIHVNCELYLVLFAGFWGLFAEIWARTGAHYPERPTGIILCNGVFTSSFIFRVVFLAKRAVSDDVRIERERRKKKWRPTRSTRIICFASCNSVLHLLFSLIPIHIYLFDLPTMHWVFFRTFNMWRCGIPLHTFPFFASRVQVRTIDHDFQVL